MGSEAPYLAELLATERPILRQHCLQRASNDLVPGDLTRLYLQLPAIGGRDICKLAPEFRYMTARARRRAAAQPQLERQPDFGAHAHYITPGALPAQKTLFITFSGQDGGFFIPFSVLVSLFPDGPKDVLAIRSGMQNFFLDGVAGLGRSAFEVANTLRKEMQTEGYNKVVVLGFSAGSIFALRVAEFLAADIAMSFAGIYPDEGFRIKRAAAAGTPGFDPICACRPMRVGRLINVLATKCEFDVRSSQRLKSMRPSLVSFHLVNNPKHNVLLPMLNAGYARVFMRAALARNGVVIWLISGVSSAYGLWFVRPVRRLFGIQKVADWYVSHKVNTKQ